jgi:hypothetical protein
MRRRQGDDLAEFERRIRGLARSTRRLAAADPARSSNHALRLRRCRDKLEELKQQRDADRRRAVESRRRELAEAERTLEQAGRLRRALATIEELRHSEGEEWRDDAARRRRQRQAKTRRAAALRRRQAPRDRHRSERLAETARGVADLRDRLAAQDRFAALLVDRGLRP